MLLVLETCGFASIPATWSHADPWPLTNALGEVQDFQSSSSLTSAGGVLSSLLVLRVRAMHKYC